MNPRHTKNDESLKIINSRDDKIRFEFDELKTKRAEIVRIYFRANGIAVFMHDSICPPDSARRATPPPQNTAADPAYHFADSTRRMRIRE